jgi:type IV secretory pathway VirB2 component (pilin)
MREGERQKIEEAQMKGGLKMRKSTIVITASMILIGLASNVYAAEILGYPMVAKQAKLYSIILGVIAASVALVGIAYLGFWLADLKKRVKVATPAEKAAFAGKLVGAVQSAR